MKKYAIFMIFMLFCSIFTQSNIENIFAENIYYGRALSTGIYMYSSPQIINDKSNKIFEIPVTYFVQLLADENQLFYKAKYNDIIGYVIKNEIACIDKIPNNPYVTNANFRIFTPSGTYLRNSPYESVGATNIVTTIPFMETNLVFYGNCDGEEAISYKGTLWYFCKYIKQNQEYYGYVYSPLCDMLTPIPQNTEQFEYITPNFEVEQISNNTESQYLNINTPWHIVLIIIICLPCVAIIYFLFKPTKIAFQKNSSKKHGKNEKKKISRLKHSDYYELDSDYFN